MQWLPREDLLTFEEIERLARVFVERFDVDGIRLTGGEPTVRAHLPVLVDKLATLRLPASADSPLAGGKPDLSITTNGATFRLLAHELRAAGLDRVNISLDSLRRDRFLAITRRDDLAQGARRHRRRPGGRLRPGEGQLRARAGRQRRRDRRLRRLGPRHWRRASGSSSSCRSTRSGAWGRGKVVGQDEIVAAIDAVFPLEPAAGPGCGTGRSLALPRRRGATSASSRRSPSRSAATATACGSPPRASSARACSRRRSSTCGAILRGGGTDDDLAAEIKRAVGTKWAGHAIGQVQFIRPNRSMSQIGG